MRQLAVGLVKVARPKPQALVDATLRRHSSCCAQVFVGPSASQPFELRAIPTPPLQSGEILVKNELATICGSDLHTISGTRCEPLPLVLGHESVGTVIALGSNSDPRASIGDRVTWSIADSCGKCAPCTIYRMPQKCNKLFKYGHASMSDGSGLNGAYSTHTLLRAGTHLTKLPPNLSLALAAPANCALATMCNALDVPFESCDRTALVQGAGLLGIYACALLKTRGFQTVFCSDVNPLRLNLAEKFGAHPLDGSPERMSERLLKIRSAAPDGADLVVEVAGSSSLIPEGLQALRFGGHYAFVGMVHPKTSLEGITGEQIVRKCVTIRGTHNYAPKHLDDAVDFLVRHGRDYPFEELVSPPFALKDLARAFEEAQSSRWVRVSIDTTR